MSIITYPLNGITYDAEDAETYLCTRTSGVYADDDCFDISITDDMEITISPGIAWIRNTDFKGKSICLDEDTALTLSLGSGSYPRTDRIVLRFDKESNESVLDVLEGTASSSANPPDVTQSEYVYELGLYEIYIPAGTTELATEYITDTRTDESVCGIMSDGVTRIPTATLYEQWESWFEALQESTAVTEAEWEEAYTAWFTALQETASTAEEEFESSFQSWFDYMKDQLSEDAAGNLQLEIDDLAEDIFNRYYSLIATTTVFNSDGTITVTNDEATVVTVFDGDTITETVTPTDDTDTHIYIKTTVFDGDTITESYATSAKEE